jgi:hypothetical protein
VTPVDLTKFAPPECPHHHVLRYGGNPEGRFIPGRVLVSFVLCLCPAARTQQGGWGHVSVQCRGCEGEGRETAFLDPPCSASG